VYGDKNRLAVGEAALAAYYAGLCTVLPRMDGIKAPIGEWREYQRQRPGRSEIENWYGPNTGVGLVCGEISGNLGAWNLMIHRPQMLINPVLGGICGRCVRNCG
jgi:hypothetical protein